MRVAIEPYLRSGNRASPGTVAPRLIDFHFGSNPGACNLSIRENRWSTKRATRFANTCQCACRASEEARARDTQAAARKLKLIKRGAARLHASKWRTTVCCWANDAWAERRAIAQAFTSSFKMTIFLSPAVSTITCRMARWPHCEAPEYSSRLREYYASHGEPSLPLFLLLSWRTLTYPFRVSCEC
jgi:hypothetical protein